MIDVGKKLAKHPDAEALMTEVYNFEESLAKTFIPREQRRDTNKIYKKMTLNQYIKSAGDGLDLMDFLKKMFNETGYDITEKKRLFHLRWTTSGICLEFLTQLAKE
ncbi:Endothelin-converting enzyme 2 [Desmophyllum pertusum]|uniref:Endothelin-converting enzyme 2 n=1 Tax=Desmophyllum pertusum TaxID=174260 RepID=A0A9W9YBQ8_9CNID|nr:Endothelin-converting enzyme 2 [Desmophyllum pertusum]